MPDPIFADPRLAIIYDEVEPDRRDLDHYEVLIDELGAGSVLDIGCGTGELARRLVERGIQVTGLDPAAASLAVARDKVVDGATWVLGDVEALPVMAVDLVTMTGNVAQVFLTDESWSATLHAARRALVPSGHLVFEARDPSARAWEEWTRHASFAVRETSAGPVECWVELTEVRWPLVSFRWTYRFPTSDEVLESHSTLRFRDRAELESSLRATGFAVDEVRDAPDRPGLEMVFIARSVAPGSPA